LTKINDMDRDQHSDAPDILALKGAGLSCKAHASIRRCMPMKRPITWILIADDGSARVVSSAGKESALLPVDDLRLQGHPLPDRELGADRPGRSFDRTGEGRHGMEPRTDPHLVEEERFARKIVTVLDQAARRQRFDRLVLVAPPKLMGMLRGLLPPNLMDKVGGELTKDLTKIPSHELPEHLEPILNP
jgi:protein required for attachment to host cells